jgi:CDP-2,3-bis-(O-geranylgeranyl)-sn-glycerol synthase
MEWIKLLQCWLLLVAANGAPVIAARLLRRRGDWPVDAGLRLADGEPLFGPHKTWRGLIAALTSCAALGALLGVGAGVGAAIGALAMTGDLAASCTKRRLRVAAGGRMRALDQLPESLLPMAFAPALLDAGWFTALAAALLFAAANILVSPLLFRLGIRRRPF